MRTQEERISLTDKVKEQERITKLNFVLVVTDSYLESGGERNLN